MALDTHRPSTTIDGDTTDACHDLQVALDVDRLADDLREFAEDRNWTQFHNPKNLAMALAGEVGELVAEFQWLTPAESETDQLDAGRRRAIEDEIADVMIYLVRLADRLNVDLAEAVDRKLESNRRRYTVEKSHGSAAKIERTRPA